MEKRIDNLFNLIRHLLNILYDNGIAIDAKTKQMISNLDK